MPIASQGSSEPVIALQAFPSAGSAAGATPGAATPARFPNASRAGGPPGRRRGRRAPATAPLRPGPVAASRRRTRQPLSPPGPRARPLRCRRHRLVEVLGGYRLGLRGERRYDESRPGAGRSRTARPGTRARRLETPQLLCDRQPDLGGQVVRSPRLSCRQVAHDPRVQVAIERRHCPLGATLCGREHRIEVGLRVHHRLVDHPFGNLKPANHELRAGGSATAPRRSGTCWQVAPLGQY